MKKYRMTLGLWAWLTLAGTAYSAETLQVVKVTFQGNTARVDAGSAQGISSKVNGANVFLTNSNTTKETEVVLSGTTPNGSLTYNGSYKCRITLNGVNLTSTVGEPLDIQCGKRVDLELAAGTTNTLVDAAKGQHDACLYCKGHLEIGGGGTLNISGNARHAISTKEYLKIKKDAGVLQIKKSSGDAIHAGQYFQMNGGTLNISGMKGDGIQAEMTKNRMDEYNGQLFITGGTLNMTVAADDTKGLKSDRDLTISGGKVRIEVKGAGSKGISCGNNMTVNESTAPTDILITAAGGVYVNPEDKTDTVKCTGIKVDRNLTISAGKVTVKNTGDRSKTIKVDGAYHAKGGKVDAGTIDRR